MLEGIDKADINIPDIGIGARFVSGFIYIKSIKLNRIVKVAGKVKEVTGYSEEEWISGDITLEHGIFPEDLSAYLTSVQTFLSASGQINATFLYSFMHKTIGRTRLKETTLIVPDKNGAPEFIVGNIEDNTVDYLNAVSHRQLIAFREAIDRFLICTITEPDGKIIYANRKFSKRSGYPIKDILGNTHSIVSSGHHDERFWDNFWTTLKSGKKWGGVILNRDKNGEKYWEEKIVIPVTDSGGSIINYISLGTDITARFEMEQKLLFFKEAIDVSPDMMLLVDARTYQILDCNRTSVSAIGYGADQLAEMTLPQLLVDVSENELRYYLEEVQKIKNGRGVFEANIRTSERKSIAAEFVFSLYHSKKWGDRIIFSVRDISGKRELQRELESHRSGMSEIANIAKMGTWEWRPQEDSILLSANSSIILGLGDSDNKITFDQFQKMIHPMDLHLLDKAVVNIFNHSDPAAFNYRIATSNGAEKHIMLKRYKIDVSSDNKITSVHGFAQDITEIRKAQIENEYYHEKVEQMVFQTSHHLRASVSTILGVLEVFKSNSHDVLETEKLLSYISDAALEADENLRIMFRRLQEAHTLRK
jgi:PAS domain S-box-containing protein